MGFLDLSPKDVLSKELDAAAAALLNDPASQTRAAGNATYAPATGSPNYDAAGDALVNALIFGGK